jgi:hypothetical protein
MLNKEYEMNMLFNCTDLEAEITSTNMYTKVKPQKLMWHVCAIFRAGSAFSFLVTKNSVALVGKRTISTELPPLVGEVSANLRGQRNEFPRPLISVF